MHTLTPLFTFLKRIKIRSLNRFVSFTTTYPGFPCTMVDKSSFLFMYDEIFEKGIYTFTTDTDSPYIIDAGANIGLATIYFKKQFPSSEVVAFEPDPAIFSVLQKNITDAGVADGTTCVQACLAETAGEVTFTPDGADGGTMSKLTETESDSIRVPAIRLDTYLTKHVDFLKMDIEGAEYEVLTSITDQLPLVKNIFVEYHSFADQTQHFDDILHILKKAGFRYYIEHIGIRSEKPYVARNVDHGMDMQINIYGYRETSI